MDPFKFIKDNTYGINSSNIPSEKKVDKLLIFFSSVCAATAGQPIPFADIFRYKMLYENGGYWVGPTLIDGVAADMPAAKEEIFGPVLSIVRVKNLDEALKNYTYVISTTNRKRYLHKNTTNEPTGPKILLKASAVNVTP